MQLDMWHKELASLELDPLSASFWVLTNWHPLLLLQKNNNFSNTPLPSHNNTPLGQQHHTTSSNMLNQYSTITFTIDITATSRMYINLPAANLTIQKLR
jgi:hypothetical protein